MLHLELLPDADVDTSVRADWARLEDAGLPNLSRHRSEHNRPHVTLSIHADETAPEPGALTDRLAPVLGGLPLPLRTSAVAVFGTGPYVLVRTCLLGAALLQLHHRVLELLGPPCVEHCAADAWVPHLTLARRLDAEQVGRALRVLGPAPSGRLTRVRLWDSTRREVTDLGPDRGTPWQGAGT